MTNTGTGALPPSLRSAPVGATTLMLVPAERVENFVTSLAVTRFATLGEIVR
jgi:hypothetical protein